MTSRPLRSPQLPVAACNGAATATTVVRRVVITGAAGAVGSACIAGLLARPARPGMELQLPIRCLDIVPTTVSALTGEPWPEGAVESVVANISSFQDVAASLEGMDAVLHLAGVAHEWEANLQENLTGTYNLFEAAKQAGVVRIATASRAGVTGQPNDGDGSPYRDGLTKTTTMEYKPVGHYTISKVFHEAMGYSYAQQYGIGVVCCRIGNFSRERDQPVHPHHLGWHDCGEVFIQAVTHPLAPITHVGGKTTHNGKEVRFYKVFAVSDSTWPMYDLDHGRRVIGYFPTQKSEVPFVPGKGWVVAVQQNNGPKQQRAQAPRNKAKI
jgi:nucleoside-diphosphate-sugar epimerase